VGHACRSRPGPARATFAAVIAASVVAAVVVAGAAGAAGCGAAAPQTSPTFSPAATPSSGAPISTRPSAAPPATPAGTPAAAPPVSPAATPAAPTRFAWSVTSLGPARRAAMIRSGSWSPRCPVALDDLRLVSLTYWGFDGRPHVGRLVVNRDAVTAIVGALRRLYRMRFPIRRMVPIDAYGANDERSMEADNTSAFNGRFVAGSSVWSQHAFGRAIDVDPLENPEIRDGKVYPTTAGRYADRALSLPGTIVAGGPVVRAFAAVGWGWGGWWHSPRDYQHFSATGT
jgi:hypothetical protein